MQMAIQRHRTTVFDGVTIAPSISIITVIIVSRDACIQSTRYNFNARGSTVNRYSEAIIGTRKTIQDCRLIDDTPLKLRHSCQLLVATILFRVWTRMRTEKRFARETRFMRLLRETYLTENCWLSPTVYIFVSVQETFRLAVRITEQSFRSVDSFPAPVAVDALPAAGRAFLEPSPPLASTVLLLLLLSLPPPPPPPLPPLPPLPPPFIHLLSFTLENQAPPFTV